MWLEESVCMSKVEKVWRKMREELAGLGVEWVG